MSDNTPEQTPIDASVPRPEGESKPAVRLAEKHPLAIRWMHWVNFPLLVIMIWSGLLIYWADSIPPGTHASEVYRIGIGNWTLFRFFPDWFWNILDAPYQLTKGLGYHFFFMWLFAANGLAYVLYTWFSGEWRYLVPNRNSLREAWQVTLHDLGLRKPYPSGRKYNGAQQIAYSAVILMGAGSLLTGFAIYKPAQGHLLTTMLGGYETARWLHFWLTIGYCVFFVIHVAQVARAGWNNLRSMVAGHEVVPAEQPSYVGGMGRELLRISTHRTRRSFLAMAAAAAGGYWLYDRLGSSRQIGMLQWPLRRAEEYNAALFRKIFRERGLAPTYPLHQATGLRLNGDIGLSSFDLETWRLKLAGAEHAERYPQYSENMNLWAYQPDKGDAQQLVEQTQTELPPPDTKAPAAKQKPSPKDMLPQQLTGTAVGSNGTGPLQLSETQTITIVASAGSQDPSKMPGLLLSMDDLRRLPHRELVTQFKCIEGWSQIVQWGGVRLADFINAYPPARTTQGRLPRYIYMETPDGEYFCGFDLAACMHPQSLLVYEMGGQPLTPGHGAPLRLAMPIKYGYKQIKQIGLIRYTDTRPNDYWAELGYDWYAGL